MNLFGIRGAVSEEKNDKPVYGGQDLNIKLKFYNGKIKTDFYNKNPPI